MIELCVALVVFCLAIWVVRTLVGAFHVPEPIAAVVLVVVVIVAVLYVLRVFTAAL